jgi:predicted house-cleaning NTP pyrophosphatase (Maf/HAM1 superfamily)
MDSNTTDIELGLDKQKAEEMLNKEALRQIFDKQNQVPNGYFEAFDEQVLNKIKAQKRQRPIINIMSYKPYLMAAAITILIATTYIFIKSEDQNATIAKVNIQDIPTEEIDSYVNDNESLAEIDWQAEINTVGNMIDDQAGENLLQDTNNKQN